MKELSFTMPDDMFRIGLPEFSPIEKHLLNIYWCKKELEEYLPNISTYATPREIAAITLSQLAIIEKHLITVLQTMAAYENPKRP